MIRRDSQPQLRPSAPLLVLPEAMLVNAIAQGLDRTKLARLRRRTDPGLHEKFDLGGDT